MRNGSRRMPTPLPDPRSHMPTRRLVMAEGDRGRGGAWTDEAPKLRSAARRASDPSWIKRDPQRPQSIWWLTDAEFVGFRIVRPVEVQGNLKGLRSPVTRESPDYIK